MTKALVTIEVDINTNGIYQSGLGESSNPNHPTKGWIENEKRGYIWDCVHSLLANSKGYTKIVKVSLIEEVK